jgi:hypothetical protein
LNECFNISIEYANENVEMRRNNPRAHTIKQTSGKTALYLALVRNFDGT